VRTIAYLDANSGSLIGGAIAAGGAAVVVFLKTRTYRFTRVFRRRSGTREAASAKVTSPEES
jgi:predicted outer membrane repeat protein